MVFTIQIQSNLAGLIGKENLEICLSKDTREILESKETVVGNVHLTVTLSIKYSA